MYRKIKSRKLNTYQALFMVLIMLMVMLMPVGSTLAEPDTTVPLLQSAEVNETTLILTYNEELDGSSVPANTDYIVHIGNGAVEVSSITITGTKVTLTLTTAVVNGDAVTLDYTQGANPVKDATGNRVADLSAQAVANNTPDTTAPVLQSAAVNGTSLTLTYDEALDGTSIPASDSYVVTVGTSTKTVSNVAISEATVTLTLSSAVINGELVSLAYTQGTNPVQDVALNPAADFTGQEVVNNTPETTAPVLQSAAVNGTSLILIYDEALDETSIPAQTDYAVKAGVSTVEVSYIDIKGTNVTLTLASAVAVGDEITLDYEKGTNPVKDLAGNDAERFLNLAVTNDTLGISPVVLSKAVMTGCSSRPTKGNVILTFSGALGENLPAPSDFKVYGSTDTSAAFGISAVSVSGNQATLSLANNKTDQYVYPSLRIDYTSGTNPLKDANGKQIKSFTNRIVRRDFSTASPFQTIFFSIYTGNIGSTTGSYNNVDGVPYWPNSTCYYRMDAAGNEYVNPLNVNQLPDVSITPVFCINGGGGLRNWSADDQAYGLYSDEWIMDMNAIHIVKASDYPNLDDELSLNVQAGGVRSGSVNTNDYGDKVNQNIWVALDSPSTSKLEYGTNYKMILDTYNYDPATGAMSGFLAHSGRVPYKQIVMEFTTVAAPTISSATLSGSNLAVSGLPNNTNTKEYYLDPTGSADIAEATWTAFSDANGSAAIDVADTSGIMAGTSKLYWRYKADTVNGITQMPGEAVSAVIRQDIAAPLLQKAEVNGTVLTLTYSEALADTSVPAGTDYTVHVGNATVGVNNVAISGTMVTLTLASPVVYGNIVTLNYTKGTNLIKDIENNENPISFIGLTVVNNTLEAIAPVLKTATADYTAIKLSYNEALDGNSIPANTDYTVHVGSGTVDVCSVAVSGQIITLTLVSPILNDQVVTLDYEKGTNPVKDLAGNDAAGFLNQAVTNNTPGISPVVLSKAVMTACSGRPTKGNVILTFSGALGENLPAPSDFKVYGSTDASKTFGISAVSVSGNQATLSLANNTTDQYIYPSLRIDYTPGTNPLKDANGKPINSFKDRIVRRDFSSATPFQTIFFSIYTGNIGSTTGGW